MEAFPVIAGSGDEPEIKTLLNAQRLTTMSGIYLLCESDVDSTWIALALTLTQGWDSG